MGGKTSQSTQQIQVPAEVLARYSAANQSAATAAQRPFQVYSTNPSSFVAPLTTAQQQGIGQTTNASNAAQPYYQQGIAGLQNAQAATVPLYGQASSDILAGQAGGDTLNTQAGLNYTGAFNAAQPLNAEAGASYTGAFNSAQPLNAAAGNSYAGAFGSAQPYNAAATGLAVQGGQAVDPSQLNIGQYLSPYLSTVLGNTSALINQNNQQQQAGQLGNAIRSGAFGGDRAGIAAANLSQQQNLAAGNIYSGILNQGFNTALGAAQQQQGVGLEAGQANRAATQSTSDRLAALGQLDYTQGMGLGSAQQGLAQQQFGQGLSLGSAQQGLGQQGYAQQMGLGSAQQGLGQQQFGQDIGAAAAQQTLAGSQYGTAANTATGVAGLGAGAQSAALQGASAELGAGQAEQQTQQAGLTALYNQFLQQQSYPFQTSQFLANIAEGTGALSGNTTTTTQPGGLFSDERLKDGMEPVGKTFDGQNIYSFRYKGDPTTRMGLSAQEVERHHPDAVGLAGGYRTVDYGKATEDAAGRGHFRQGGLAASNDNREPYADGGLAYGTFDLAPILAAQAQMYGPMGGGGLGGGVGHTGYVPSTMLPVGRMETAGPLARQETPTEQANQIAQLGTTIGKGLSAAKGFKFGKSGGSGGVGKSDAGDNQFADDPTGLYARGGFAGGDDAPSLDIPDDTPQDLSLMRPGGLPGGGHSTLGDIEGIAKTGAKVASLFLARGGLAAQDDDPDEPNEWQRVLRQLALGQDGDALQDDDDTSDDDASVAPPGVSTEGGGLAGTSLTRPSVPDSSADVPSPAKVAKDAPDFDRVMKGIAKVEGTGKNPRSSAKGPFQIIDPTFVGAFKQMFPDRAKGMSKADILALRQTPEGDKLASQMGPMLAHQNIERLQHAGFDASAPNVYLAHFLGPTGAIRMLGAEPDTPASSLVSPEAVDANREILRGKTAGDVIGWATRRLAQADRMTRATGGRARMADGGDPDTMEGGASDDTLGGLSTSVQNQPNANYAPVAPLRAPANATAQPATSEHHGWTENLKKPEVFIPILTGLAAMASAPTSHFGTALAVGLGAGANTYQAQREFQRQQQETGYHGIAAEAQQTAAGAAATNAQTHAMTLAQSLFDANWTQLPQMGPDNQPVYRNNITRQIVPASEYGRQRAAYLQAQLSQWNKGGNPANAASTILPQGDADGRAVPYSLPAGGGGSGAAPVGGGAVPGGGDVAGPASGGGGGNSMGLAQSQPQGGALTPGHIVATKLAHNGYSGQFQPIPQIPYDQLDDNSNPVKLRAMGQQMLAGGGDPAIGQGYLARADAIGKGQSPAFAKDGQPFQGFAAANQIVAANEARRGTYAGQVSKTDQAAQQFATEYPQNTQILNSLVRLYTTTDTDRKAHAFADLIGAARSVPGLRDMIGPELKRYESATDEATKDSARLAITQGIAANMLASAPAAALGQTNLTVPDPSRGPGARYHLVSQLAALQQQSKDFYNDWNAHKGDVQDVASFVGDWNQDHPIERYEKRAYDIIPPFAGMSQQEMMEHPRKVRTVNDVSHLVKGTPFVIPSGPNAGKIGFAP